MVCRQPTASRRDSPLPQSHENVASLVEKPFEVRQKIERLIESILNLFLPTWRLHICSLRQAFVIAPEQAREPEQLFAGKHRHSTRAYTHNAKLSHDASLGQSLGAAAFCARYLPQSSHTLPLPDGLLAPQYAQRLSATAFAFSSCHRR